MKYMSQLVSSSQTAELIECISYPISIIGYGPRSRLDPRPLVETFVGQCFLK